jgi:hypothetical protein
MSAAGAFTGFNPQSLGRPIVGLIAGAGRFPIVFAEKAKSVGVPVVCVGVYQMADPALQDLCTEFHWLRRMSLGFVFKKFQQANAKHWTMAGKYYKHVLFQPGFWWRLLPDWQFAKLWFSRRADNKDDSLLLTLIGAFEKRGMTCVSALDVVPELLVREGVLTNRKPSEKELADIQFGWRLAKEMGRLDIGQSVMVRNKACLAVEAIEGTDQCILRAGALCKNANFVVVKVAKPQQDMRFDVPTVGLQTLESMKAAGATVLAVEADKTILLDEAATIAQANTYGMTIVALPEVGPSV